MKEDTIVYIIERTLSIVGNAILIVLFAVSTVVASSPEAIKAIASVFNN